MTEKNMEVKLWKIDEIRPYDRNPRLNDKAVDSVAESLRQFGFRQPIVVDASGVIIAGHTRWKAARQLGLVRIPVHVATDLTEHQVRAYRLADNKSAEIATWDFEILPIEISQLVDDGVDLSGLGFSEKELTQLLDEGRGLLAGQKDADDVPAALDQAITRRGDLWCLGNHRLFCGDSGDASDLEILLDGQPIHMVNTDPPYGVNVEPRSKVAMAAGNSSFGEGGKASGKVRAKDRVLANDDLSDEDFAVQLRKWFGNIARVLQPGRAAYIWGGYANCANYPSALAESGLYFSQAIIWDKQHPVVNRKDFMCAHEWCFYCWREGAAHKFFGPNNAQDLWRVKKVNPQAMIHLTQKPTELAVRAIQYSSRPGENVLDLFGGSGSTLIACEQTERRCYTMELDELYCDVIVKRWEEFTGKTAERILTKKTPASAEVVEGVA